MKKKFYLIILLIVIILFIKITLFAGNAILKEKYCYNFAFIELDKKGIKLGELSEEFRGIASVYSPLSVKSTPGSTEWEGFYLQCRREFNPFSFNFSVLRKVYPDYYHFIDW